MNKTAIALVALLECAELRDVALRVDATATLSACNRVDMSFVSIVWSDNSPSEFFEISPTQLQINGAGTKATLELANGVVVWNTKDREWQLTTTTTTSFDPENKVREHTTLTQQTRSADVSGTYNGTVFNSGSGAILQQQEK